jgi:F0F1-type ATP synthase membrane subunit b/b'
MNGGREIADEAIRQNEEEAHRASEEARRNVERERRIVMFVLHSIFVSVLSLYLKNLYFM